MQAFASANAHRRAASGRLAVGADRCGAGGVGAWLASGRRRPATGGGKCAGGCGRAGASGRGGGRIRQAGRGQGNAVRCPVVCGVRAQGEGGLLLLGEHQRVEQRAVRMGVGGRVQERVAR
jgi:hypothetical protein